MKENYKEMHFSIVIPENKCSTPAHESVIYYGRIIPGCKIPQYILPLNDLSLVESSPVSLRPEYIRVNEFTEAKRTITGKFKIRRIDDPDTIVTIPRRESRLIRKHL